MKRRGFTLIEVMVSIVLSAGVLMTARAVLAALMVATARMDATTRSVDQDHGAIVLLRSLMVQARDFGEDSVSFFGNRSGFVARSWCPVAGGWQEPCDVSVVIADSGRLAGLSLRHGIPVPLIRSQDSISILFLRSAEAPSGWVNDWGSSALPLAIGIVRGGDTLIVTVGR